MPNFLNHWRSLDWGMIIAVILLSCFSLITIYSLDLNQGTGNFTHFYHQLTAFIIGLVLVLFFSLVNIRYIKTYSFLLYLISLFFLVAVLFFGQKIRGTTGWLVWGNFSFQPVELAKVFFIIFLANYLSQQPSRVLSVKKLIVSFFLVIIPVILVAIQPDYGSASIFLLIWLVLIFIIGLKKYLFPGILIALIIFSFLTWNSILTSPQKNRFLTFIFPSRDPYQSGYQISQAEIAVGSGQLWGRGLGLGPESQLHFLPDPDTDFIFAVIAEEFGFLGTSLVLVLYFLLFYRLFKLLLRFRTDFPIYFLIAVIILFFLHLFINIGMNIRLMPIMGLPLPFLSYGGSFLVTCYLLIALVQNLKQQYQTFLTLTD